DDPSRPTWNTGYIDGALVEANTVYNNGLSARHGSGIGCDGVRNTTLRNNLIYDTHNNSGIALYTTWAGHGPAGNAVVNNTVVMAADGGFAVRVWGGAGASDNNAFRNNIFQHLTPNAAKPLFQTDNATTRAGVVSDYNVFMAGNCFDG